MRTSVTFWQSHLGGRDGETKGLGDWGSGGLGDGETGRRWEDKRFGVM